jgi:hypothetical protein
MDRGAMSMEPPSADAGPSSPTLNTFVPRHSRRLSDKLLVAFHHACDVSDLEVADQLLRLLELMTTRRPRPEDGNRRRSIEGLVAAHERLWHLRHPETE